MSGYEFNHEENTIILSLAKRMRVVSLLMGLTGLIALSNGFMDLIVGVTPTGIGQLIAGAFALLQAVVFFRPTDNLKHIVTTEGEDIAELMQGMGELAGGLKLMVILLGLMAVVLVIAIAA